MMKRCFSILALICFVLVGSLTAQELTIGRHRPIATDSIIAYKQPFQPTGNSGEDCVWDFSDLSNDSVITYVDYYRPQVEDSTLIGQHREHTNYYYSLKGDSLFLTSYELATTKVNYTRPECVLAFPFTYGDSIINYFDGRGEYCHRLPLRLEGTSLVRVDAIGRLILPDITIDKSLRVHIIRTYTETLHTPTIVQVENYQWYGIGCRYPLFETTEVATIHKQDTTHFAFSYYYPQTIEQGIVVENEDSIATNSTIDDYLIDVVYQPNPVQTDLQVSYSLLQAANVYMSLHYNGGIEMYRTAVNEQDTGTYQYNIDMSSYPSGAYVLYIYVNDMIWSETILKM